jgi:hypothetical protein
VESLGIMKYPPRFFFVMLSATFFCACYGPTTRRPLVLH